MSRLYWPLASSRERGWQEHVRRGSCSCCPWGCGSTKTTRNSQTTSSASRSGVSKWNAAQKTKEDDNILTQKSKWPGTLQRRARRGRRRRQCGLWEDFSTPGKQRRGYPRSSEQPEISFWPGRHWNESSLKTLDYFLGGQIGQEIIIIIITIIMITCNSPRSRGVNPQAVTRLATRSRAALVSPAIGTCSYHYHPHKKHHQLFASL